MKNRKTGQGINIRAREEGTAQRNRAMGLAIALLLFVFILYIATYAKLSA